MLFVALLLYVLGCVLMVDNIRATPPDERWTQSGFVLLIIIWGWPFATATILVHDLILRLFLHEKPHD
jgi:hypothetical protein